MSRMNTAVSRCEKILTRVAQKVWKDIADKADAPIPTVNDLLEIDASPEALTDMFRIYAYLHEQSFRDASPKAPEKDAQTDIPLTKQYYQALGTLGAVDDDTPRTPESIATAVDVFHKGWIQANDPETEPALKHPLQQIIKDWQQEQFPKVEPERRTNTSIIPHNLRHTSPSPRLQLTVEEIASPESKPMTLFNNIPKDGLQLEMPGFVFPESELVPALPLVAYDSAEGKMSGRGRGAPIAQRLFVNILIEHGLETQKSVDEYELPGLNSFSRLNSTYRDIKSWLYPNGTKESRKTLIPKLYEGMWHLHNLRFIWERREWCIIAVDSLPTMAIKPDDKLTFIIRMPDGLNTRNGALIGIEPLRLYGAQSAPKFRAWVRLAYLWDAAKLRNGGNRIYATVPEVARNSEGHLLDAKRQVILMGKLRKTKAGWQVFKGSIPQTGWYHPLAIQTGKQVRNPQADKVPVLSDTDMVKLFYDHTERKGQDFRNCLRNARKYAQEMQADGRIIVEVDQVNEKTGIKGWRILEPWNMYIISDT